MTRPLLHLLFSPSAAGTLRETLARQGRVEQVICLFDDFSFGPIARDDAARIAWIEEELGITEWDGVVKDTGPMLRAACSDAAEPVLWISRREARSHAGFLWWLWHRGNAPCTIIDVTDVTEDGGKPEHGARPAIGTGALSPDAMARLLDTEVRLGEDRRRACLALWRRLRSEDAPFRVVGNDGVLASAPISYFDPLLLSCAVPEWWKAARIVGEALCRQWEENILQTGDIAFFARLCRLAEDGALEWRGDLASMRTCEFRLPALHPTGPLPVDGTRS